MDLYDLSILNLLFSFYVLSEPSADFYLFETFLLPLRPDACLFIPGLVLLAELFLCDSLELDRLARADVFETADRDEVAFSLLPQASPKSVLTTSLSTRGLLPVARPIPDSLLLLFVLANECGFYESYPVFDI